MSLRGLQGNQSISTHPRMLPEQQSREQWSTDIAQRSACLRHSGPCSPLSRLHDVDDDNGRHGEHPCGTDTLKDSTADQLLGCFAGGSNDGANGIERDTGYVCVLAAHSMRYVGEDELEDGLGEEVAGGDREDEDLVGFEVFRDSLEGCIGSAISFTCSPDYSRHQGAKRCHTGSATATEAMSRLSRNCSRHEHAKTDHFRHTARRDKSPTCTAAPFSSSRICVSWMPAELLLLLVLGTTVALAAMATCSSSRDG